MEDYLELGVLDLLDRERIVDCLDCFWINFFENDIMLRREF